MPRRLAFASIALAVVAGCSGEDQQGSGSGPSGATAGAGASGLTSSNASSTGSTGGSTSSGAAGGGGAGGGGPEIFGFPPMWNDGTDCGSEPDFHSWAYAEDTYILRQTLCSNFEGPFLYLLFGEDKVLVEDTGTGHVNAYQAAQAVIAEWLTERGKSSIEILLTHSHGHGDHVGGDGQFQGQPEVTFVAANVGAIQSAFGIASWPTDIVELDLGGRVLDVIAIPGHQSAHIAFYDRRHDLLLTGDTLYPGRLYISDWQAYRASIGRMVDFVTSGNPVTWVLGTHVEMTTTPGVDFNFGADQHPNEHELELSYAVLEELHQAVEDMGNNPVYEVHDDFIVYP